MRNVLSPALLTALTTKILSPQTTGLAFEMPGIGVFQRTFFPASTFHSLTAPWPSPLPAALAPRNAGHGMAAARFAGAGEGTEDAGAGGDAAGALAAGGGGAPGAADADALSATRTSDCVVVPCVSSTRSIIPPRPENATVTGAPSILKEVCDVGTSGPGGRPGGAAPNSSPDSVTISVYPVWSLR